VVGGGEATAVRHWRPPLPAVALLGDQHVERVVRSLELLGVVFDLLVTASDRVRQRSPRGVPSAYAMFGGPVQ
jgi:hypothetical protein